MGRPALEARRQRRAVNVGIVGQHPRRRNGQRRVFGGGVAVGGRHWRIVDRVDEDRRRRHVRGGRTVAGGVGKAVGAVEVGARRIAEAAVGVEGERAVLGATHHSGAQRAALDVDIVGQHPRRRDRQHAVFVGAVAVVGRHRDVVDGRHRDGDGDRTGVVGAVVGRVHEAVGAVEVGGRRVDEAAVRVEL